MKTSAVIAAAGLAAASEAILLPPGSYDLSSAEPTFKALPFAIGPDAEDQTVKLDCPGCPIVVAGDSALYRTRAGDSSHLELEFSIDHARSGDRLLLNGFEIYPESDPLGPMPLRAMVKPDTDDYETQHLPIDSQDLGFSLRVNPAMAMSLDGKNQLVAVDFQVIEIGNTFIQGLDSVHLKMLKKTDSGALMIAQVETGPSENPVPQSNKEPCRTLMCALMGSMDKIMNQVRPHRCNHPSHHHMGNFANMMGHIGKEAPHHAEQAEKAEPKPENKVNQGEGQIHHHPQRTWASLFKQLSYSIILPILIGIVAGISVSIIGMIIGTLIVGTWRVFVRGKSFFPSRRCCRRRAGSARKAAAHEASVVEEKAGLMTNMEDDTLPMYTDEEVKKDTA
ncbi:hypothetical protein MCOR27_010838 [Pyricularia oryzae]|uniref:DUF7728 domain-containing protein n=2 Tax=Pyricularia TaxID=48558 RepID=A0ABQ8N6P9_PYRGI|nr:hypothetical protein MCOR01_009681 [Pyricularia oryzae]KAI6292204.1 hypothetical protein MCOR33_010019 [Pyricularia grisea]KAH9437039.1 hypothetical protein MCOR02_000699 [Pyricularia oryzae]KAI6254925.1 hypothetical protein MCOR19_008568 [Pyricularia oryzae]KAI6266858.1 hypothetical protein MCOR27_010838 [Pyricularia oryzae]